MKQLRRMTEKQTAKDLDVDPKDIDRALQEAVDEM
jgi:hypothetical protein